jgi:hypothetical protein
MDITMDDIKEKFNKFNVLLEKKDATMEDVKETMKQVVPTFHEPEEVNTVKIK